LGISILAYYDARVHKYSQKIKELEYRDSIKLKKKRRKRKKQLFLRISVRFSDSNTLANTLTV